MSQIPIRNTNLTQQGGVSVPGQTLRPVAAPPTANIGSSGQSAVARENLARIAQLRKEFQHRAQTAQQDLSWGSMLAERTASSDIPRAPGLGAAVIRGSSGAAALSSTPSTGSTAGTARISGVVTAIRHAQLDQDFYIFTIQPVGARLTSERITVKGNCVKLDVGMDVDIAGEWVEHPKYGRQIDKAMVNERLPVTAAGIKALLSRGFVKGIGPAITEGLMKKFGAQLFDIAEKNPEYLTGIPGLDSKRSKALVEAIREKRALPRIMSFLAEVGLGPQLSHRVYRELGNRAVDIIKTNPYSLASLPMIGFLRADAMARTMGVPFDSKTRIQAGMEAALQKAGDSGSTAMRVDSLKGEMGKLLTIKNKTEPAKTETAPSQSLEPSAQGAPQIVDPQRIADVLKMELILKGRVVTREMSASQVDGSDDQLSPEDRQYISLGHYARDEKRIAQHLARIMRSITVGSKSTDLSHPRFAKLDPSQLSAVRSSLASNICVITGRPGCGKTTVTKSIIETMEAAGKKVMLVAPTGRAAQRMQEATGRKALTVHRALKSTGEGKFLHDEENPLDADVIFADEFSMMDTMLTERFLRAIKSGTRLVMVGDRDQLPSIGAGNVLSDLIESNCIPVAVLNQPHRTAADSSIITNAHRIINGQVPEPAQEGKKQDFFMVECHDKEKQVRAIVTAYQNLRKMGFASQDIQILSPMRKADDTMSSTALNLVLKEPINPVSKHGPEKTVVKRKIDYTMPFNVGDRVMQLANNKELGIFNGDVGYVTDIDRQSKTIEIRFGEDLVDVPMADLDDLDLAYATTIHKSQGSEYKAVIIPLSKSHSHMLDRNLLYTAVTRGKQHVVLVGDTYMLKKAVEKANGAKRVTGLIEELRAVMPVAFYAHQAQMTQAKALSHGAQNQGTLQGFENEAEPERPFPAATQFKPGRP